MTELHPVVGHEEVRTSLARAHARDGLPAAILLHGMRGVGKQRVAQWIAQLQVCERPRPDGPCDGCRACRLALALEHPDVHWYFPLPRPQKVSGDRLSDALESARISALAELREQPIRPSPGDELRGLYLAMVQGLRRRAHLTPTMARVQPFIIADAEYLVPQEASPEAANAILKLLEEPPGGSRFILTSAEPGRLLPTIRSRCVPLHLSPLPTEIVADFLSERRGVERVKALWAAGLGQGSIGRALGFLPDPDDGKPGPLEARRGEALVLVESALSGRHASRWSVALASPPTGARKLVELFAFVEEWLRDLAAVAAGAEERVRNQDALPRLRELVGEAGVGAADTVAAFPAIDEAREMARGNVNPQLILSMLIRRLHEGLLPGATGDRVGGAAWPTRG